MAYNKPISSDTDINNARVTGKNWRSQSSLLKSFIQVLDAMSTHLPSQVTSGTTHYFALDEESGKVKVNPYISSRLSSSDTVIGELSHSDIKDYREAVKGVLQNNELWDNTWEKSLTTFNSIGFGSAGRNNQAATTAITESLQAFACACRQAKGSKLEVGEFIDMVNEESDFAATATSAKQNTVIKNEYYDKFKNFVNLTDDGAEWAASSVYIANKVFSPYVSTGSYKFYRQDQYPTFKGNYKKMVKDIKANPLKREVSFVYDQSGMAEDKWNPADIIAVKKSYDSKKNYKATGESTLETDSRELKQTVKLIDDFKNLYEYNKWIHEQFEKKNIIPISLKKTQKADPHLEIVDMKDVSKLDSFVKMDVNVTSVDYKVDAQKCIINFEASGFPGAYLDARGFEESGKIADIQIQLQQKGSSANHGKVTLPVTYLITRFSKGTSYFQKLQRERRKCFGNAYTKGFFDYKQIRDDFASESLVIEHKNMYAEYIHKLSGGKHNKNEVIRKIDMMLRNKSMLEIAKYIKNKVQSYEVGYLLDNNSLLTKQIKENILKSMYLYASSKGFYIFRDAKVKSYMQSSTYLKVGG